MWKYFDKSLLIRKLLDNDVNKSSRLQNKDTSSSLQTMYHPSGANIINGVLNSSFFWYNVNCWTSIWMHLHRIIIIYTKACILFILSFISVFYITERTNDLSEYWFVYFFSVHLNVDIHLQRHKSKVNTKYNKHMLQAWWGAYTCTCKNDKGDPVIIRHSHVYLLRPTYLLTLI